MRAIRSAWRALLVGLVVSLVFLNPSACRRSQKAGVELRIGENVMRVEVADTPQERSVGFFGRPAPADGEGILFVFERQGTYGFIMSDGARSVPYELGIAFVNAAGTVTEVRRLAPGNAEPVESPEKTLYAIEGSWEYYEQAPVRAGMTVRGLPRR